jgi:hypothetical protein
MLCFSLSMRVHARDVVIPRACAAYQATPASNSSRACSVRPWPLPLAVTCFTRLESYPSTKLPVGLVTRARVPLVTSTKPLCCYRNRASRTEGRPTPKRSARTYWEGNWLPISNSAPVIAFSSSSAISWEPLRRATVRADTPCIPAFLLHDA